MHRLLGPGSWCGSAQKFCLRDSIASILMPSDPKRAKKVEAPHGALTAGGWLKPTVPPIRAATQAIPGLPSAPKRTAGVVKPNPVSAMDKK